MNVRSAAESTVAELFSAQLDAMVAGDTEALGDLLDAGYTLTHMTSYEQPKDEWLSEMRAGQFVYHRIDGGTPVVKAGTTDARVLARTMTDATVYGHRSTWRLQLDQHYRRHHDSWIATRCLASTW